ncbi:hypothetical protein M5K25_009294 [Dendrobium thyrsiflorum]|uniref:Uncharacterized protein n=1 Tax=Dendrobium thyrsiflorum TaxID=117978 RepID=A0ABD0V5U1_DENTH
MCINLLITTPDFSSRNYFSKIFRGVLGGTYPFNITAERRIRENASSLQIAVQVVELADRVQRSVYIDYTTFDTNIFEQPCYRPQAAQGSRRPPQMHLPHRLRLMNLKGQGGLHQLRLQG